MPDKKYTPPPTHDVALAKLQHYCAYQDRCHQEVRSKLLDLGMRGHDLEVIISELIEENFLNEERFARSYARGKFRIKRWGRIRIRQELRRRNISAYCIKKGMSEIDETDYLNTLESVLLTKKKLLRPDKVFNQKNKLAQHGIRRGFESALVWEMVHGLFDLEKT